MKGEIVDELLKMIEEGSEVTRSAKILSRKYGMKKGTILGWFYNAVPKPKVQRNSVLDDEAMTQLGIAAEAMSLLNLDWSVMELKTAAESMFGLKFSLHTAY